MEGFIADLEHEAAGTSNAVPAFELRTGFLQFFITSGQMAAHLKLCQASPEMNASTACQSFIPLGEAYESLEKKIEKDQ